MNGFMEEVETVHCPMCDDHGGFMGTLGTLDWFRCIGCGWEFSVENVPVDAGEGDDDDCI